MLEENGADLGLPKLAPYSKSGTVSEGKILGNIKYNVKNLTVYNLNRFQTKKLKLLLNTKTMLLNFLFQQIVVST